jgi:hypothetical protein
VGVVGLVVQAVVDRLGAEAFTRPLPADFGERVEPILREAVSRIGGAKDAPVSVAPERLLELARDELLELGPLGDLMADGSVSEIGVVRFDQVVATRAGRTVAIEPGFSSERALGWAIERLRADAVEGGDLSEFRVSSGARVSADVS